MNTPKGTLKRTPLYNEHITLGARMVSFGGWEMPLQYAGILAEYEHTRKAVTLFDTSHMGEFIISGDCLANGLDGIVTMSITDMPIMSCRYGMILNDQGGVIDDLIVFREERKKWFIVVNGATTFKDAEHFSQQLKSPKSFEDISTSIGKIDIQGPLSCEILKKYIPDIIKLTYYSFNYFNLFGNRVLISRTGYTGELGYEIYSSTEKTATIWRELLTNKEVKPAGLGARDVLRLEAGYSLYGHELNEDISPIEAGLSKFVDLTKNFIGKNVLMEQKNHSLGRIISGITSQTRRSPRQGQKIFLESGEAIGTITSGTFSPFLQKGIGLGFISKVYSQKDTTIYFGEEKCAARITGKSFYKNNSLKKTIL